MLNKDYILYSPITRRFLLRLAQVEGNPNEDYLNKISFNTKTTYSHGANMLKIFIEEGLVIKTEGDGRTNRLKLTKKGWKVIRLFNKFEEIFEK